MEVHVTTGAEAVRATLLALLLGSHAVESRHGTAHELTGFTLRVERGHDTLVEREDFDQRLAVAEALHLISGVPYGPRIRELTAHLGSERWAPGHPSFALRLRDHLPAVIWKLTRTPDTRQAVIPIWHPDDLGSGNEDYLCATGVQFLMRRGALELVVSWRSNDVWHGLPYNLFAFGQLQATMARALKAGVGPLTFQVGSLHLYDRHVEKAWAARPTEGPLMDGVGGLNTRLDPQILWLLSVIRASQLLQGPLRVAHTDSERVLLGLLG